MRENLFDTILREYSDAKLLSEGGQKSVFKITHPEYGESVIKIGDYEQDTELERITREVEVLRSINSEYFPQNYEFEVNREEKKFEIIEEYVQSVPLSEKMGMFETSDEIFSFLLDMVTGLKILWDKKIVHRDIKPGNILITDDDAIKIIDLGIARVLDAESLTATACLIGPCTAIYASPEQIQNHKLDIDWRSDQFSLGILAGQLLCGGQHPFSPDLVSGNSIVTNIIIGNWFKDCLETVDKKSRHTITKMLGHKRYQRFRTPEILMRELRESFEEGG